MLSAFSLAEQPIEPRETQRTKGEWQATQSDCLKATYQKHVISQGRETSRTWQPCLEGLCRIA